MYGLGSTVDCSIATTSKIKTTASIRSRSSSSPCYVAVPQTEKFSSQKKGKLLPIFWYFICTLLWCTAEGSSNSLAGFASVAASVVVIRQGHNFLVTKEVHKSPCQTCGSVYHIGSRLALVSFPRRLYRRRGLFFAVIDNSLSSCKAYQEHVTTRLQSIQHRGFYLTQLPSSQSSSSLMNTNLSSLSPRRHSTFLAASALRPFLSSFQSSWSSKDAKAVSSTTSDYDDASVRNNTLRFLEKRSLSSSSLLPYAAPPPQKGAIQKHFIFLVHGWLGNESEMAYLETSILRAISSEEKGSSNIVVHKAKCNEEKTTDGIANGGARLADEMIDFISTEMSNTSSNADKKREQLDISISIVGNSLGGLYSRYALSLLPSTLSCSFGKVNIHFNIFCTTATPHLGVASHTYLPIPRIAEKVIGNGLAATGRDLFCLTEKDDEESLIYQMATHVNYTHPLAKFRKRIAYANAFDTDFQVPTETAAFLCRNSTFFHWHKMDWGVQRQHQSSDNNSENEENTGNEGRPKHEEDEFIAVIFETEKSDQPPSSISSTEKTSSSPKNNLSRDENLILTMSTSLDSLGWTKVFVDVRDGIPVPSMPKLFADRTNAREHIRATLSERHDSFADITCKMASDIEDEDKKKSDDLNEKRRKHDKDESQQGNESFSGLAETPTKRRRTKYDKFPNQPSSSSNLPDRRTSYIPMESREVTDLVTKSERLHFPLGHTVMVANSKSDLYARINYKGRPVMDKLAESLVRDILEEQEVIED